MSGVWHQAGCCCLRDCEWCDADTTSRVVTLTLSGITACGCQTPTSTFHTSIALPATVAVVQTVADPCLWTATNVGVFTRKIYASAGCTGAVTDTKVGDLQWELRKGDGIWTLEGSVFNILSDEHYCVFLDTQAETDCSAGVIFTNDFAIGNCNDVCGTNFVVGAHSGTATKAAA